MPNNKWKNLPEGSTVPGVVPESEDQPDWRGVIKSKVNALKPAVPDSYRKQDQRYFWFDTPDYADPFKKLKYLARESFLVGTLVGSSWAFFATTSDQSGLKAVANIFKRTTWPVFFTSMAAGATVITVANLRGRKDDIWNYVIGGFVGCLTYANYKKSNRSFTRSLILFWPACIGVKYNAEINGSIYPALNVRRLYNTGLQPTGEDGVLSGDLRFWHTGGDPGRDVHHQR